MRNLLKAALLLLSGSSVAACTTGVMQDTDLGASVTYRQPGNPTVESTPLDVSPALADMYRRVQSLESEAARRIQLGQQQP